MPSTIVKDRMKWDARSRVIISLVISVLLTAADFTMLGPPEGPSSRIERFWEAVNSPVEWFADFLGFVSGPPHTGEQILIAVAWLLLAVIYDAALLWIVLSLPTWWRNRA